MNSIPLILIIVAAAGMAYVAFRMASCKNLATESKAAFYYLVSFLVESREESITIHCEPDENHRMIAEAAVKRYCEAIGKKPGHIFCIDNISQQEYADIRKALYLKLNQQLP